jgi:hypothetical protein
MPPDAIGYEISDRIRLQALPAPSNTDEGSYAFRPLRIYTLDPSVSHRLGGVATVEVPYEELKPGPVGALFEIDLSGAPAELAVRALDLDERAILLSGGLTPSPSEGRFHLQMAYAVCSLTYAVFQRALGREIVWSCGMKDETTGRPRLAVRPFALRGGRNAYYSRESGCVAMGYFKANRRASGLTLPGGLVFTGLSHDILVHETTHALLDALRSEFSVPTHPDVLGFHEGFADLVALFQHFSYPGVVANALREAGGSLAAATLLVTLAQEFGHATARGGPSRALRSAVDVTGLAAFDSDAPVSGPDVPRVYSPDLEEHEMGSVLVSAVFEAFTTIFRRKAGRYLRLAGASDPRAGGLSDALVDALASEASAIADHFLDICVRAVDYCPPVDLELGEYLRALITADLDVVGNDQWGYREALLRSFRRRHLFPDHVAFMSEDAVKWKPPAVPMEIEPLAFSNLRFSGDPGHPADPEEMRRQAHAVGRFVTDDANARVLHLATPGHLPKGLTYAGPVRVQSVRCARRVTPGGRVLFDLIAEVTQSGTATKSGEAFDILGGCTLVIAPSGRVRYAIYKKLDSSNRQERQREALRGRLAKYWRKEGGRYVQREDLFKLLHLTAEEPRKPRRASR